MKSLLLFLLSLLGPLPSVLAQPAIPGQPDILTQIYPNYDRAGETAHWNCKGMTTAGWLCATGDTKFHVAVEWMAAMQEDQPVLYVLTSAIPGNPSEFQCHACAPIVGAAVFHVDHGHWTIRSSNLSIGPYGGWGAPPDIDLVTIGANHHGFLLSMSNEGQGFSVDRKVLLAPINATFSEIWTLQDEDDDFGAYDPSDPLKNKLPRYRSSAVFKFLPNNASENNGYYEIEVLSRGQNMIGETLRNENWMDRYRFKDGSYKLIHHVTFREAPVLKSKR